MIGTLPVLRPRVTHEHPNRIFGASCPRTYDARMRTVVAMWRLGVAVALAAALALSAAAAAPVQAAGYDFLAYFVSQASIVAIAAWALSGAFLLARGPAPAWVHVLRGAAVSYAMVMASCRLIIALPWQASGGFPLPVVNVFVCLVAPVLLVADWVLVGDRRPLSHSFLRWVAAYPVLWCTVTLLRGLDAGWSPYPLLNPASAGARLPLYLGGTCLVALAAGAIASWISRRAPLLPMDREARAVEAVPVPAAPGSLDLPGPLDLPPVPPLVPPVQAAGTPVPPAAEPPPLQAFTFVDPPAPPADVDDDQPEA